MKIIREGVEQVKKSYVTTIELPKPKVRTFYLSRKDISALESVMNHYDTAYHHVAGMKILEERKKVKELLITQSDNAQNMVTLEMEPKYFKQLEKEANKLNVSVNDYVRGIIYTRSKEVQEDKLAKQKAFEERKKDNRIVKCNVELNKELREKLYKKYGQLSDKELQGKVQEILETLIRNS